jgi:hypothetical protein
MPLPTTEVRINVVENDDGAVGISVTASRNGKERTWSGEGKSGAEATQRVVEKMLQDPRTGEFLEK